MKIFAFIEKYCQDLVDEAKTKSSLIDLVEFPHDLLIEDVDGNKVPAIWIDSVTVPISDIITMDVEDFCNAYPQPHSREYYTNYLSTMDILEGPEVVMRIRNAIFAERARIEEDLRQLSELDDVL